MVCVRCDTDSLLRPVMAALLGEEGFAGVLAPRAAFSVLALVGLLGMVERVFRPSGGESVDS